MREHEDVVYLGKRGNRNRVVSAHTDKRKRDAITYPNHVGIPSLQGDNELGMEWEHREQEREHREQEREDRECERGRRDQHRMDKVLHAVEKISEKVEDVIERFEDLQEEVRARPTTNASKSHSRAPKSLRESALIARKGGDARVDLGLASGDIPEKYHRLRNDVQVSVNFV